MKNMSNLDQEKTPGREPCFIWSHEHQMWWRDGRWGYTHDVALAGVYTRDMAESIAEEAAQGGGRPESVVPALAALEAALRQRRIISLEPESWKVLAENQAARVRAYWQAREDGAPGC